MREGNGKPVFGASDLGLNFKSDNEYEGLDKDISSFLIAATQEANNHYDIYCANQHAGNCGYASPAQLYMATHGTTVITFSSTSVSGYHCERNANAGNEGVICYKGSRGEIDPVLAAHELAHWFNYLVDPTALADPYDDLSSEYKTNPYFPILHVDITPGYLKSTRPLVGEDFANMYSMWVFDSYPDTIGGAERRKFMTNNMYVWIEDLLNK